MKIRAVIDRALTGRGSVVMLEGGTGVCKTRLAMEMAEYSSRVGFRCLLGVATKETSPFRICHSSRSLRAASPASRF